MLHLILYKHSNDTLQAQFLEFAAKKNPVLLIAPNPQMADFYRDIHPDYEVVTIAAYLAEIILDYMPKEKESFKGKAEVLTLLAASWKKQFPARSYDDFEYCYNILSDLRSYSLSIDILSSVLEEYPDKVKDGVLLLHRVLSVLNVYDEHEAYSKLAEYLRTGSWVEKEHKERHLMFAGFRFFTGIQIDFLKALAINHDVFIPLPKLIYDNTKATDWPKWLADSRLQIHHIGEDHKSNNTALKVNLFNSDEFNLVLKDFDDKNYFMEHDLLLLDSKLDTNKIQELPLKDIGYKISISLFEDNIDWVNLEIAEYIASETNTTIDDLVNYLEAKVLEVKKSQDYIKLKVYILYRSIAVAWAEWLGNDLKLSAFDLTHFHVQAQLKQTRNSLFTQGNEILDKNSLLKLNFDKDLAVCLTKKYQSLKTTGEKYSTQIEKILAPIGPIRRSAFDYLFFKASLEELISENQVEFFLDFESYENDLGIRELLENKNITLNNLSYPSNYRAKKDVLTDIGNKQIKNNLVSATRLQTYLDCPRKYQLNYLSDLKLDIEFSSEIQKFEIGRIEHLIIEKYSEKFNQWDQETFDSFTPSLINQFLKTNQKQISRLDYQVLLNEVMVYASNGLKELYKLNFNKKEFEVDLKRYDDQISGRIDFLGIIKDTIVLIDFKRSKGSIPSKKDVLDYKKIQLSFYLSKLSKENDTNNIVIGYMDLSDPTQSLYFYNNELDKDLLEHHQFCNKASFNLIDDIDLYISEYQKIEHETISLMNEDTNFYPIPESDSTCRFCLLKSICPKERLGVSQ